jgi:hypothetical protein
MATTGRYTRLMATRRHTGGTVSGSQTLNLVAVHVGDGPASPSSFLDLHGNGGVIHLCITVSER